MDNFKEIAEKVLNGELSGTFVLLKTTSGTKYTLPSTSMKRSTEYKDSYELSCVGLIPYIDNTKGLCTMRANGVSILGTYEVMDFLPNKSTESKVLKVQVPDGYEIDKEKSTFEEIVFKKVESKYPTSWEEYCNLMRTKKSSGYGISAASEVYTSDWVNMDTPEYWRTTLPYKELADAFIAMMKLMSLRQAWIHQWSVDNGLTKDWSPKWNGSTMKYSVVSDGTETEVAQLLDIFHPLSFPTKELTEDFLSTFKDLIEQAKDLI